MIIEETTKKPSQKPKLIVILGPTASGKTSLAVKLCKTFNGEIVSADSRQIYKGMDIGTAKVADQHRSKRGLTQIDNIPIYMVDIVEPNQVYTVAQYKKDAEKVIADIIKRRKVPFLVGGTGLYVDAVVDNFQIPTACRGALHAPKIKKKELSELVKMLLKLDPDAKYLIDLKNRRRVERALEVCLVTGKPFTKQKKKGERQYEVLKIGLKVGREELHKRINKRVKEMMKQGLLKEVANLAKKYGWENEAMTGIGYREFSEYFACDPQRIMKRKKLLREAIEQIKINTRRYAKRQMTWFKRDKEINWAENYREVEKLVKKFLAG